MARLSKRQKEREQLKLMKKREFFLLSVVKKYENGTLTEDEFKKIPFDKQTKYLEKELINKYPNHNPKFSCHHCACNVVFGSQENTARVSDVELLQLPNTEKI